MELIFQKMLNAALVNLKQLNAKGLVEYKVICGKDEYGGLDVAKTKISKRKKDPLGIGRGTMRNYVLPFVKDLQPGDITSIPLNKYPPESVRGNASSWCSIHWGAGTYTTSINHKNKAIEVYRFPNPEQLLTRIPREIKEST